MESEIMDVEQLASFLRRDAREISKWASRGYLPAMKVRGEWRFVSAEISEWLEKQLPGYTAQELSALEAPSRDEGNLFVVSSLMSESTTVVPLAATTRSSVLKGLVKLAEQSWQVRDADALLEAVRVREELSSTALECGVALPHPRRPLPAVVGESLVVFARTWHALPFGGERGMLTDLFFLVCCRDRQTHLSVLARLSRLLLQPEFVEDLRASSSSTEALQIIEAAEAELAN